MSCYVGFKRIRTKEKVASGQVSFCDIDEDNELENNNLPSFSRSRFIFDFLKDYKDKELSYRDYDAIYTELELRFQRAKYDMLVLMSGIFCKPDIEEAEGLWEHLEIVAAAIGQLQACAQYFDGKYTVWVG